MAKPTIEACTLYPSRDTALELGYCRAVCQPDPIPMQVFVESVGYVLTKSRWELLAFRMAPVVLEIKETGISSNPIHVDYALGLLYHLYTNATHGELAQLRVKFSAQMKVVDDSYNRLRMLSLWLAPDSTPRDWIVVAGMMATEDWSIALKVRQSRRLRERAMFQSAIDRLESIPQTKLDQFTTSDDRRFMSSRSYYQTDVVRLLSQSIYAELMTDAARTDADEDEVLRNRRGVHPLSFGSTQPASRNELVHPNRPFHPERNPLLAPQSKP